MTRAACLWVRSAKYSPERAPYDPDPIHVVNPYQMKTKLYTRKGLLLCVLAFWLLAQLSANRLPKNNSLFWFPTGIIGFLQFTPPDYGSQKHPLIIFYAWYRGKRQWHYPGTECCCQCHTQFMFPRATMKFTVNGVTSSFVVLSPQLDIGFGIWPTWYVDQMIQYAKANLQIDTNRIYVCGLSLGGGGVWDYAFSSYANAMKIAACTPVCGTDDGSSPNACSTAAAAHLPIWAFHCLDDGTVGWAVPTRYVINIFHVLPLFRFHGTHIINRVAIPAPGSMLTIQVISPGWWIAL